MKPGLISYELKHLKATKFMASNAATVAPVSINTLHILPQPSPGQRLELLQDNPCQPPLPAPVRCRKGRANARSWAPDRLPSPSAFSFPINLSLIIPSLHSATSGSPQSPSPHWQAQTISWMGGSSRPHLWVRRRSSDPAARLLDDPASSATNVTFLRGHKKEQR